MVPVGHCLYIQGEEMCSLIIHKNYLSFIGILYFDLVFTECEFGIGLDHHCQYLIG